MAKVLDKRGVRFDYNDGKGAPGRRIGVIANDWEAEFPELVDMDSQGIRHFDYAATWGLSVELFRRQQAEIDELKRKIAWLDSLPPYVPPRFSDNMPSVPLESR